MDLRDQFWEVIQQKMIIDFGNGHPRNWQKPEIDAFRVRMNKRLQEICREDDKKARLCKVPTLKGNFEYHRLQPLSYDAFRKIFKVNESKGGKITRNQFAIYFGADSYEDFLLRNEIKATPPKKHLINENESSEEKLEKKSTSSFKFWYAIGILFLLFLLVKSGTCSYDSDSCELEAIANNQVILITTDAGLNYIDPSDNINQVIAKGPNFTGFDYDQKDKLVFWSNTNHNYRSIGRADLSKGLQDDELNHRFIKDLPYPIGIALDEAKNILYLADYGSFDQVNDGSIRAYDYEGNFLKIIYQDSIDPSSIILDAKSQILYWTDPHKRRIGNFDLEKEISHPNFLVNIGSKPDGLALDKDIDRLYWASNKDSLIGWVDLNILPLKPNLHKLWESASALSVTSKTGHLLYSTYDQEKIKWLQINGDSVQQSICGQTGIQTDAGSPRVIELVMEEH